MKQGDFTQVAKYYINRPAYSAMLLEKLFLCVTKSTFLNFIQLFTPVNVTGFEQSLISDFKLNSSKTLPIATNKFWILVKVLPNVFTGLYNSNNEVTNDAKLPAVISPELIR